MEEGRAISLIIVLFIRIIGAAVCSNKAKELNRNTFGWGIFGFLLPIIAMIWVQFMKPVVVWENETETEN